MLFGSFLFSGFCVFVWRGLQGVMAAVLTEYGILVDYAVTFRAVFHINSKKKSQSG
jgi:hypothetical protein